MIKTISIQEIQDTNVKPKGKFILILVLNPLDLNSSTKMEF